MNSPGPLLSRLDELLQWQREQQEKLLVEQTNKQKEKLGLVRKQFAQETSLGNSRKSADICNPAGESGNVVENERDEFGGKSLCETSDDLTAFKAFDETPLKQVRKSFSELLEERLECTNKDSMNVDAVSSKPKRKFLKKGEGLARFRMKPLPSKQKSSTSRTPVENLKRNENMKNKKNNQSLSLMKKMNYAGGEIQCREPQDSSLSRIRTQTVPLRSVAESEKSPESERSEREREELRLFELMEQHAANSSFCSTSSLVARFMEGSSYSPTKKQGRRVGEWENVMRNRIKGSSDTGQPAAVTRAVLSPPLIEEQEECPQSGIEGGGPSPRETEWDEEEGVAFADFEVWSECSCSSCGDEESPAGGQGGRSPLPVPKGRQGGRSPLPVPKGGQGRRSPLLVPKGGQGRRSPLLIPKGEQGRRSPPPPAEDHGDSSSSAEIRKDDQTIVFKSALLRERYQELENEISFFKTENAKLDKLRKQHEEEVARFKQEKKALEKTFKENTEKLEDKLQEERKKLARERQVFEKYCKGIKSQPTKQEREEIQALKMQISELKEELVGKDRRWSASQVRTRDRMRQLTKQISQLKEENEKLKNEAAKAKKVRFSDSKKKSDSKMKVLHAVNDQLGRLKMNDINAPVAIKNVVPRKRIPASVLCHQGKVVADTCWRSRPLVQSTGVPDLENAPNEGELLFDGRGDGLQQCNGELQSSDDEELQVVFDTFYSDLDQNIDCSFEREMEENDSLPVHTNLGLKCDNVKENVATTEEKSENGPGTSSSKDKLNKTPCSDESNLSENEISSNQSCKNVHNTHSEERENGDTGVVRGQDARNPIQVLHPDGTREKKFPDGRQEIWLPNGNLKKVSADKMFCKMIYYNGDVKENYLDEGMEKYFYAETRTWQTTYANGLEILEFPSGQVERKKPNGDVEICYPNGCMQLKLADGSEEWTMKDGTRAKVDAAGNKEILLPNGQKEVHTREHKRREYPDGTVKYIYQDGTMETRYSDGRIRLKDKDGNLIMDSGVR